MNLMKVENGFKKASNSIQKQMFPFLKPSFDLSAASLQGRYYTVAILSCYPMTLVLLIVTVESWNNVRG